MSEKYFFIKNRFEKVPVQDCFTTVKRYADDNFLFTILKLKLYFALMTSHIIIHDVIFMMTFHNVSVFQK